MNLHSVVAWMRTSWERLAGNRRNVWSLSDSNRVQTHNHLVCKWTLNHLAKLTKELLDIQAIVECRFTLKRIHDMIITYSQMDRTDKYQQRSLIINASLAKLLSVHLWINWLWVRIMLLSLNAKFDLGDCHFLSWYKYASWIDIWGLLFS